MDINVGLVNACQNWDKQQLPSIWFAWGIDDQFGMSMTVTVPMMTL